MASKVEGFTFSRSSANGRAKYDWTNWLDGSVWAIVQGEDFVLDCKVMTGCIWTAARAKGLKVRTSTNNVTKTITLQAYKPEVTEVVEPTTTTPTVDAPAADTVDAPAADATVVEPTTPATVAEPVIDTVPETVEPVAPALNSKQRAKAKKAAARLLAMAEQNGIVETV